MALAGASVRRRTGTGTVTRDESSASRHCGAAYAQTVSDLRDVNPTAGIVCSSRELFGADRSAVRLARVLRKLGYRPTLLLPSARPELGLAALAREHGVEVAEASVAVASSGGLDGWRALSPGFGARPEFDLLIYNSAAVLAANATARRRVTVVREWLLPEDARHRAIAEVVRRRSDHVVAIGRGVAEQWRAVARRSPPISVVPNWLDDDQLALARPAPGSGVLCLGRFNAWKGQQDLADAYELVGGQIALPPLTFVGAETDGPRAAFAAELDRRGQVNGLWTVEPAVADPREHLRAAALVVVPSQRPEPFGMVVLEALAEGAQVVAYEGGGPTELQARFGNAIVLAQRDVAALAGAIADWVGRGAQGLGGAAAQDARAVIDREYSESRAVTDWVRVLEAGGGVRHSP